MQNLAERLRWARNRMGLSQSELAEEAGLTQATVNKLESGKNKSTSSIVELADALKVRIHWLHTGHGAPELEDVPHEVVFGKLEEAVSKLGLSEEQIKQVEKVALEEAFKIFTES